MHAVPVWDSVVVIRHNGKGNQMKNVWYGYGMTRQVLLETMQNLDRGRCMRVYIYVDVQQKGVTFKLHAGWFINRTTGEFINRGLLIKLKGLHCGNPTERGES